MKKTINILLLLSVLILFNQCAKEAAPTGGPKDFDPPVVLAEVPQNHSVNYTSKKAKIYFDEFVSLKNLQEELLISPPFERKPKFVVKGKRLVITFLDSLPKDKTINLNFYNAIVDVNESNALSNYQYVFSTGSEIDTSFIDGRLLDAQTGDPIEKKLVFAYENFNDSIVSRKLPSYIARTNKDGIFVINNLGKGPYKLFSVLDKNRNDLFDQSSEPIAFNTDSIFPRIEWTTMMDTVKLVDSIIVANNDTLYRDSVVIKKVQVSKLKPFQLRVFTEDYKKHYLANATRERKYLLSLGFNRDIDTIGYELNILSPTPQNPKWYREQYVEKDSILIWITDSTLYNADSIYCSLSFPYTDTSNNIITRTDSIYFLYDFNKVATADTSLVLKNNLRKSKLDIDTVFKIEFSEPIKSYDPDKIYLKIRPDTAFIDHEYILEFAEDSLSMIVRYQQDLLSQYKFIADSNAFTGIFGNINDSLVMNYPYYQFENYGNLILTIDTLPQNSIFRLYNKAGNLTRSIKPDRKGTIEFKQLPPDEYKLKVLLDANQNGKWDTGNYYKKIQPELVIAFPAAIPIKENWDTEQAWQLIKELKLYD
jgi:hypothetical protein